MGSLSALWRRAFTAPRPPRPQLKKTHPQGKVSINTEIPERLGASSLGAEFRDDLLTSEPTPVKGGL